MSHCKWTCPDCGKKYPWTGIDNVSCECGFPGKKSKPRSRALRSEPLDAAVIDAEARYIVMILPLSPSKNQESWDAKARRAIKHTFARHAYDAWLCSGRPHYERVRITPVYYVWNLRDEDNYNGIAFKGVLDGLKGWLMPDDSPRYLDLQPEECLVDRKCMRLELHIMPWPE